MKKKKKDCIVPAHAFCQSLYSEYRHHLHTGTMPWSCHGGNIHRELHTRATVVPTHSDADSDQAHKEIVNTSIRSCESQP